MREEEKKKQPVVDQVGQAQLQLRSQMAQPGGYRSPWQSQLDDTMNRIMNREKFSYDLNGDALWKQYKDQYTTGGKMAMMDTMGQAAQLTGGYGNSYAQGVGQQAYQGYMQGLTDKIPELYQLALDQYDREGSKMLQDYSMLQDREDTDYGRYQDQMALIQPQVMEMIAGGVMPSDEMLAASGLSPEYLQMLMANGGLAQQGNDGRWYVNENSDWFLNNLTAGGWITTSDGNHWLNTEEGRKWAAQYNANYPDPRATLKDAINRYNSGKIDADQFAEVLVDLGIVEDENK